MSFEDELSSLIKLVGAAQAHYSDRAAPYNHPNEFCERLTSIGLRFALSALRAAQQLLAEHPLWACVCCRSFLEYALRLLWATTQPNGHERMYHHYAAASRRWQDKTGIMPDLLKLQDELAPLSALADPMPDDLMATMRAIGTRDSRDDVPSLYVDPDKHYRQTVHFLHMHVHANPLHSDDDPESLAGHAVRNLGDATVTLIRAVGYQLGWDQREIFLAVCRVKYFVALPDEDRIELRKVLHSH
jgi:hypothetical protein